ncbi:MAG: S41 family peptidase [Sphingobacteriia bacterium]|nr:S41 family peptidase [Sphingobacteriia bacterium]
MSFNIRRISITFITIILTVLISNFSLAKFSGEKSTVANILGTNSTEFLALFYESFAKVKKEYVTEVSDKELIEAAINGMLSSLDPHSAYWDPKSFEDMRQITRGEYGGLGMEVTMENGLVKVVTPIEGTPAEKVGMKPGDFIIGINTEPVFGLTLTEAVEKMKGKAGTEIKLTITRDGLNEPLDINLIREIIKIRSTRSKLFEDIAYVRLNTFNEKINEAMIKEYDTLKSQAKKPLKGLILDLRNNPGGLLEQAVAVADSFLNEGKIVTTKSRNNEEEFKFSATKGDITNGLPIVVLINNGTASAPEIVAGALQDNKRAIILGTKSFGKGSVQTVMPMSNGGAMKITTARYYTPADKSIQAEGITPDIYVEQAKIEKAAPAKLKIHESTLHRHLEKVSPEKEISEQEKKLNEMYEQDFQLARAIDVIKTIDIYSSTGKKK